MSNTLFFNFTASLIICVALIPVLTSLSGRFNVLDLPGGRKVHTEPIVRVGGIAFAIGASVALLIWAPRDEIVLSCLLGGLTILLFGVWDDRVGLGYKTKLLGQLIAAAIVVGYGDVRLHSVPFLSDVALPLWLSVPLTLVVLAGAMNAINLIDGLDGLAGGLSLLSLGGMACLAHLSGDSLVVLMAVSVLGGLLGFLRFNTYPAKIFMGDGGSQFLGFYLGVTAILLTDPSRGPYSPALLLLLLGLPVLDTAGVICLRLAEGRSPFRADSNHIHHKLLSLGCTHSEAVTLIYTIHAGMVSLAYLLRWQSDQLVLAVYVCIALSILSLYYPAWHRFLRWGQPDKGHADRKARLVGLRGRRWVEEVPIRLLGVGVTLFLALSVFLPKQVPVEFGYSAAGLLVTLVVGLTAFPEAAPFLVRLGLYIGSTFVMYLSEPALSGEVGLIHSSLNIFFGFMVVLIVTTIRFGREHRFQTTPLDYLIVFVAIIIPWLPDVRVGDVELGLFTPKLIVLFFSYELLLSQATQQLTQLRLISYWLLLGLGVRTWW